MSKHTGHYCHHCRDFHPHEIVERVDSATGRAVRVRVCQSCFRSHPHGVSCPKCGGASFSTVRTRPGTGCVKRKKRCRKCNHPIRTVETVISFGD